MFFSVLGHKVKIAPMKKIGPANQSQEIKGLILILIRSLSSPMNSEGTIYKSSRTVEWIAALTEAMLNDG